MSFIGLSLLLLVWVAVIVILTSRIKIHPFIALFIAALGFGISSGGNPIEVVKVINAGFGKTLHSIGIVIILGTFLGIFLERGGAAIAIAKFLLKIVGKQIDLALSMVGYLVGISVFSDTGFMILSPLNKALSKRSGKTVATGAIALSLSILASHTMVPPTPGPIAAAAIVEANLAQVIVFGLMVSFVAMLTAWLFSVNVASKVYVSPDGTAEQNNAETTVDLSTGGREINPGIALIPIVLPIVLIVFGSLSVFPSKPFGEGSVALTLQFFGQPVIALLCGFLSTFLTLEKVEKKLFTMEGWVGQAITASGNILVITGAGGAFGAVIKSSGIADALQNDVTLDASFGIFLPFLISAALKTAQGSATVAIITTAGIVAPLLTVLGLDTDAARALTVVAIGAGALVVSHANDSHFWVVTQFSNMTINQGYRLQTVGSLFVGLASIAAVFVLSLFVL